MKRANKRKLPLGRYLVLLLLAAVIGVNVYALNAENLAGNAVPMPFGVGASVVLSGSMEPELSVGDLLLLREADSYRVGDVVVYQSGSTPIVHRIVALEGETVITQGDANNASDAPFPVSAVKGKVVAAVPLVGYAVWALKSPLGILITLAAAVLLVELSYRNGRGAQEAEKEKIKAEIRQLIQELDQKEES